MKKIEHMSVKCTFLVGLFNVEVPDDVYEQLENNQEFNCSDSKYAVALEWLAENIREADAYDWEYDVDIHSES